MNVECPSSDILDEYVFDVDSFKEGESEVHFKLNNSSGDSLFLGLYNYHNGYYSHGFTFGKNEVIYHEDSL